MRKSFVHRHTIFRIVSVFSFPILLHYFCILGWSSSSFPIIFECFGSLTPSSFFSFSVVWSWHWIDYILYFSQKFRSPRGPLPLVCAPTLSLHWKCVDTTEAQQYWCVVYYFIMNIKYDWMRVCSTSLFHFVVYLCVCLCICCCCCTLVGWTYHDLYV